MQENWVLIDCFRINLELQFEMIRLGIYSHQGILRLWNSIYISLFAGILCCFNLDAIQIVA